VAYEKLMISYRGLISLTYGKYNCTLLHTLQPSLESCDVAPLVLQGHLSGHNPQG
jgi:hypothetical protein